ncbi:hypothetical protein JOF44_002816 [Brachybacterium fresconis]|uniref:Uncharacterized protein n=1 Tax=Brachybacterium fresconis TaxID=173363 RepID=A0ABS4YMC4_9MICO|nr:hypothetical protein [Brachybacterium fresconis]
MISISSQGSSLRGCGKGRSEAFSPGTSPPPPRRILWRSCSRACVRPASTPPLCTDCGYRRVRTPCTSSALAGRAAIAGRAALAPTVTTWRRPVRSGAVAGRGSAPRRRPCRCSTTARPCGAGPTPLPFPRCPSSSSTPRAASPRSTRRRSSNPLWNRAESLTTRPSRSWLRSPIARGATWDESVEAPAPGRRRRSAGGWSRWACPCESRCTSGRLVAWTSWRGDAGSSSATAVSSTTTSSSTRGTGRVTSSCSSSASASPA